MENLYLSHICTCNTSLNLITVLQRCPVEGCKPSNHCNSWMAGSVSLSDMFPWDRLLVSLGSGHGYCMRFERHLIRFLCRKVFWSDGPLTHVYETRRKDAKDKEGNIIKEGSEGVDSGLEKRKTSNKLDSWHKGIGRRELENHGWNDGGHWGGNMRG